jgi:hypothetical protein
VTPTAVERTYEGVPYLARHAPARTVRLPRGWLLAVPDAAVVAKLREHGVHVERLVEPARLPVEAFSVTKLSASPTSDQGHFTSSIEGRYERKEVAFAAGAYWIPLAQPLGSLAAQLLEPESPDGLGTWNFFDRWVAFQWIPQPMEHPVYRLHEPAALVTEAVP